jgi:uncharacterized membrane protein YcaP (DUF421 family)
MFYNGWFPLMRVITVGVCAYAALVCLLRVSGKRTLSKMNAFDLVVTVALGSTLATVLLSKDVALAEGVLAFGLLIALQFVVAWLSVRSPAVDRLVKSEPRLLFYRGEFLRDAMRGERVTEGEVLAAVREQGTSALGDVEAVVLETASTISVLRKSGGPPSALRQVRGVPDAARQSA